MPRSTAPVAVSEDQTKQIEQWLSALGTPQQVALRCRIVLAAASGESESTIASKWEINRKTVRRWRERFCNEGLTSLWEIAPGRGRKPIYGPDRIKAVIDATLPDQAERNHSLELPADGAQPGTEQVHDQHVVAKP